MNGKFVMEITVPQLQHPLLYERLGACTSARERAAVFRALAEAQLRGEISGARAASGEAARRVPPLALAAQLQSRDVPEHPPPASAAPARATTEASADSGPGFDSVRVEDSDESGGLFGSFLENAGFG